jgi:hypothetical protein
LLNLVVNAPTPCIGAAGSLLQQATSSRPDAINVSGTQPAHQGKHTFTGVLLHTPGKVIIVGSDPLKPTTVSGTGLATVTAGTAALHTALALDGITTTTGTSPAVVDDA